MEILYAFWSIFLSINHSGVVVPASNSSTFDVEARRYKFKVTLSYIARYCLNK